MKNFKVELIQKRMIKKTGEEREQWNITKNKNKLIKLKDVQAIYEHYLAKGIPASRICIAGLNAERLTTIKAFNKDDLFDYEDDDYLNGKSIQVQDKLTQFYSLQVVVY